MRELTVVKNKMEKNNGTLLYLHLYKNMTAFKLVLFQT